jgi:hypothetical protein
MPSATSTNEALLNTISAFRPNMETRGSPNGEGAGRMAVNQFNYRPDHEMVAGLFGA